MVWDFAEVNPLTDIGGVVESLSSRSSLKRSSDCGSGAPGVAEQAAS